MLLEACEATRDKLFDDAHLMQGWLTPQVHPWIVLKCNIGYCTIRDLKGEIEEARNVMRSLKEERDEIKSQLDAMHVSTKVKSRVRSRGFCRGRSGIVGAKALVS